MVLVPCEQNFCVPDCQDICLYLRGRCAERAIVVVLHPGTVKTDFTKDYWKGRDLLEPLDAADKLLRVIAGGGEPALDGSTLGWEGKEVLP